MSDLPPLDFAKKKGHEGPHLQARLAEGVVAVVSDITEWTVAEILEALDGEYDDAHDVFISATRKDGTDVVITLSGSRYDGKTRDDHRFLITILEVT